MPSSKVVGNRYELQEPIGQGGMGVVYRAYDRITKRFVALKTMWGSIDPSAVELFEKEWTVLARLCHPNIVDILDTGNFVDDGQQKPYFVMPLLPGSTLDKILKVNGPKLEPERVVEIVSQACKALQAAHDQGLVHRDLKPSNIFVMEDDTVKIIDFGVVHLADGRTVTGIKGTLHYMAPEQLEMKPATPSSDIFSLGVVCYETLTGSKPFARETEAEIGEALRSYNPPPVSEINPAVSVPISRTVHKALAKQPLHRYSSARELSETLRKALRNEPIKWFRNNRIQPRIDRMRRALAEADYQFAMDILCELESEGHIDPELSSMRTQIQDAIRSSTIRQLLERARSLMDEGEFDFALPKVESVLELDPVNARALSMKSQIERQRNAQQIEEWFRLAQQHFDNQLFTQSRQALDEVLKIDASNTKAREFLRRLRRVEWEIEKLRKEQQEFYESALNCYRNGEISTALNKLQRIRDLQRNASPNSQIDPQYQALYQKILSERDRLEHAYTEGRKALAEHNFTRALELCDEVLSKKPNEPMFQALKLEVEELRRQEKSGAIVRINAEVEAEIDLDRKLGLLKEAVERYPDEQIFRSSLKLVTERRDLVQSIVSRARNYEDRRQFSEAISQWDIVRNVYGQFPGLDLELDRLHRRREEQLREEAKARLVEEIDSHMAAGDYGRAEQSARDAITQFPDDSELQRLLEVAEAAKSRGRQALLLYDEAQQLSVERNDLAAIVKLRDAMQLDEKNPAIRAALQSALVEYARGLVSKNWRAAAGFVREALQIDDSDPVARNLLSLVQDSERREKVDHFLTEARGLEALGNLEAAFEKVEEGCRAHPTEIRLAQLSARLSHAVAQKRADASKRASAAASRGSSVSALNVRDWESTSALTQLANAPEDVAETEVASSGVFPSHSGSTARSTSALPDIVIAHEQFDPYQKRTRRRRRRYWWLAVVAAAAVAGLFLFQQFHLGVPPGHIRVTLSADAPGATFEVDGKPVNSNPLVAAGTHRVTAIANGFRSEEKILDVSASARDSVVIPFHLLPVSPQIQILSDIRNGEAVLDGRVTDLASGDFTRSDIAPGNHTLKIQRGGKQIVAFNFKVNPGKPVQVFAPLTSTVPLMVVSSRGATARVIATPGLSAGLAGKPLQPIPSVGADFELHLGTNDFVVSDGRSQRHWSLEDLPRSNLFVQIGPARETGTLMVKSNVPDAQMAVLTASGYTVLNGDLTNGIRILSLRPGTYEVRVSKNGYSELAPQTAEIKKGGREEVSFDLAPVPVAPPPVTELRSVVPKKADLTLGPLLPGSEIRSDNKKNDTAPSSTKGELSTLDVSVSPQNAAIHCRRDGESAGRELNNGARVPLPPGRYEITVTAEGYNPHSEWVTLYADKPNHVELALTRVRSVQAVSAANSFADPAGWSKNDAGWYVHAAPTYTWFTRGDGITHLFVYKPDEQASERKSDQPQRIEWVLDDTVNGRIEYSLDGGELHRTRIVAGAAPQSQTFSIAEGKLPYYQLDIAMTNNSASISIDGDTVDTVKRPNPGGPFGRLGFRGPVTLVIR
jgi:serine/threonine-protein kinase